jgi:hypothetical protein
MELHAIQFKQASMSLGGSSGSVPANALGVIDWPRSCEEDELVLVPANLLKQPVRLVGNPEASVKWWTNHCGFTSLSRRASPDNSESPRWVCHLSYGWYRALAPSSPSPAPRSDLACNPSIPVRTG